MPGPRGRDQVLGVGPERGRVEALGLKGRDGGVGGRRGDGRAGKLALFLFDERPDVVWVVGDVDAGGSDGSGRRGGGFERLGGSPVATRCGLGLGLLLGLGLGLRRGRRDAWALAVVLFTLAVVRGESDLEPRDLVVRRAELRLRGAGGSSGGYLNAGVKGANRESSGGIRTRIRLVSRTALSFCWRRIALTIAACFSALTAMSARRRDSKTSARSCEERGRF